jgi:hypothetical protein
MRFEFLPNDILIECFEYLDPWDIFYSFDQLNFRFNALIRTIPLDLNFQHTSEEKFIRFCLVIRSNPEIKEHIRSLQLSNKNSYSQIETFLSWFSLGDFHRLQGLIFMAVGENNIVKLKSILPYFSRLSDLCLKKWNCEETERFSLIPTSQLPHLSIRTLIDDLNLLSEQSTITHLTLSHCCLYNIYEIAKKVPLLKYLNLQDLRQNDFEDRRNFFETYQHVHLKQLIMTRFSCSFNDLKKFLSHTPNLKYLIVISYDHREIIDAFAWEHLISTSLPQLTTFNFIFHCSRRYSSRKFEGLEKFQSTFWHEQHRWYTAYGYSATRATIYTVPLIVNECTLSPYESMYWMYISF